MKSFGLLAASLTAVQAWQILLYTDTECRGTSYFVENRSGCRQPENMPSDFDAKSVQFVDLQNGAVVSIFTDNNYQCLEEIDDPATWLLFTSTGSTDCHE